MTLGRRRGRPITTAIVAFVALVGPSMVAYLAFPEHAELYRHSIDRQDAAREQQHQAAQSEGRSQCLLWCDAVEECRGLARDRRGRVIDASGQTACNRARDACSADCLERFRE